MCEWLAVPFGAFRLIACEMQLIDTNRLCQRDDEIAAADCCGVFIYLCSLHAWKLYVSLSDGHELCDIACRSVAGHVVDRQYHYGWR